MLVNLLTFKQDKLQGGVPITAKDTTLANVSLYLICRFVPFEIQSVEGKKDHLVGQLTVVGVYLLLFK